MRHSLNLDEGLLFPFFCVTAVKDTILAVLFFVLQAENSEFSVQVFLASSHKFDKLFVVDNRIIGSGLFEAVEAVGEA